MQWVDRQSPASSPLLSAANRPHATLPKPVFTPGEFKQYRHLIDWVHEAAAPATPRVAHSIAAGQPTAHTAPTSHTVPIDAEPPHAIPAPPKETFGFGPMRPMDSPPLLRPLGSQRGAPPTDFVPVDPFDPEIFNRRYLGTAAKHP